MNDDKKEVTLEELAGDQQSKAVALNSNDVLSELQKEVMEEFFTSDRTVYKEGLRSLLVQEQQLNKQIKSIESEIETLHKTREALDEAFKNGSLQSVEDVRGVTRSVLSNAARMRVDRSLT